MTSTLEKKLSSDVGGGNRCQYNMYNPGGSSGQLFPFFNLESEVLVLPAEEFDIFHLCDLPTHIPFLPFQYR